MIILIDSYDSFTNNLRRLVEVNSRKEVVTIYNDTFLPAEYESAFESWIRYADYIVIGPGPGHPKEDKDIGIAKWLYRHFAAHPNRAVPTLGVCLGFQSLCQEFGNDVVRLDKIIHGQAYEIRPVAGELFGDAPAAFPSVRYHSLHVDLATLNEHIVPLATCKEAGGHEVLMAGKHASLPLYGVQYHPESICSSRGDVLVQNFDKVATAYNRDRRAGLLRAQTEPCVQKMNQKTIREHAVHEDYLVPGGEFEDHMLEGITAVKFAPNSDVTALDVCDHLHRAGRDFVLLNSAADPGEWSIIGLPIVGESEVITHSVDDGKVRVLKYKAGLSEVADACVWQFVAQRMALKYVSRESIEAQLDPALPRLPFLGGYVGLFSYEEGKHIDRNIDSICNGETPDTKLVYIERFVLHNRVTDAWILVSTRPNDSQECLELLRLLASATKIAVKDVPPSVSMLCRAEDQKIQYDFPSREIYQKQFDQCQEFLHSGDSYELCLTTQLKIHLPLYLDPWDIYKVLSLHKNPSPYSSFMNFDDCVLLSSSPERFLSWKDSAVDGCKVAELRPIKGTVRNSDSVSLEDAKRLLTTPKETGENLMIVDLIRHDLQSFTQDVNVSALMAVEEYKTVYQLVSVIQGSLAAKGHKGIDILLQCLPPGSMTGAPKKRSIELLRQVESLQPTMSSGRRGIYSGVAGYWSITDDSDWSVTIRSVAHYKDDKENSENDNVWRIGAGGAITVLSDAQGEWDEMQLKLESTLQTFL